MKKRIMVEEVLIHNPKQKLGEKGNLSKSTNY
jgi:hypothetical protein